MAMTDPIADMLTRIRNGLKAEKVSVNVPASKVKSAIAQVLKNEGYINDFSEKEVAGKPNIEVVLKYYEGRPVIEKLQRISTPGRRVYSSTGELPYVIGGLGIAVISTSKGIMTEREARKAGVGGEVLCSVF